MIPPLLTGWYSNHMAWSRVRVSESGKCPCMLLCIRQRPAQPLMGPISAWQSRPGQAVDKMKCLRTACHENGGCIKPTDPFPSSSNGANNTDLIHLHRSLILLLWKGRWKKTGQERKMGNRGRGWRLDKEGGERVGRRGVRNSCHLLADENEWLTIESGWIQQSPYGSKLMRI